LYIEEHNHEIPFKPPRITFRAGVNICGTY
jgi:hypothetical protein